MKFLEFISNNEKETFEYARKLATMLKPSTTILIKGDLGAGKTVFAKGLAKGLGIEKTITSPTFTIFNIYNGIMPFYHFDLYRIEDANELDAIGLDEYLFDKDAIKLIEWPQILGSRALPNVVEIEIVKQSESKRMIRKGDI